ncbi:MAG: DUF1651 domain-containing protein [Cyanobacteria bacterium K_Offshore_surface_m2_011]|nr:DUF1651 domain-containing protein [Cyanobacteria bacterium K_Offshore_surface_m2_011]
MEKQAWIQDPKTANTARFHWDPKSWSAEPMYFVDSGRPLTGASTEPFDGERRRAAVGLIPLTAELPAAFVFVAGGGGCGLPRVLLLARIDRLTQETNHHWPDDCVLVSDLSTILQAD